jgi:hypothetical protein
LSTNLTTHDKHDFFIIIRVLTEPPTINMIMFIMGDQGSTQMINKILLIMGDQGSTRMIKNIMFIVGGPVSTRMIIKKSCLSWVVKLVLK